MTTNSATYNLTSIKQLVNLNEDKVNFDLQFKIDAQNNSDEFYAIVVTQEILDSGNELDYQKATGSLSGNILSDQNVYQNYLLLLKSDEPIEVVVTIQIRDINPQEQTTIKPIQQPIQQQQQQQQPIQRSTKQPNKKKNWLWIFFAVIIVILFLIVAWMIYKSVKIQDEMTTKNLDNINNGIDTIKNTLDLNNDSITKNLNESINTLGKTIEGNLNDNINTLGKTIEGNLNDNMNTLGKTIEGNLNESIGSLPEKLSNEIIPKTYGVLDGTLDNIREQMQDLTNSFNNNTSKIENPLILQPQQPSIINDGNNIITKIKNLKI